MCFKLLELFKPKLPHPEEKPDPTRTVGNTSVYYLMLLWYLFYEVPDEHHPFWDSVEVKLVEDFYVPEVTYAEDWRIEIDPRWANIGVVAHAMAHISYSLLTEEQKLEFTKVFDAELKVNKLLKYAWEHKPYMRTNLVEGHADCYRYLGTEIPESLKRFYIKLF